MKIQESAENYLEAILILKQNKGSVRSIDIAHYLNFSKPSVSIAMKNLREKNKLTKSHLNGTTKWEKALDSTSVVDIIILVV